MLDQAPPANASIVGLDLASEPPTTTINYARDMTTTITDFADLNGTDLNFVVESMREVMENLTRQIADALAVPASVLTDNRITSNEVEVWQRGRSSLDPIPEANVDPLDHLASTFDLNESIFILESLDRAGEVEHVTFQEVFTFAQRRGRGQLIFSITSPIPLGLDGLTFTWQRLAQIMRMPRARWEVAQRPSGGGPHGLAAAQESMAKAKERSIALLKEWLSPAQREQYERHGRFDVTGGATGTRYRINQPGPYNIDVLGRDGVIVDQICVVPTGGVSAPGDVLLAQKIWLEKDEVATLKIANKRTSNALGRAYFEIEGEL
jgi:hypothetical protein